MRTEKIILKKIKVKDYWHLINYAHYSNNLYNFTLYNVNEYYKEAGKYLGRFKLNDKIKNNENYKLLPAQSAQQIIKIIDQNFRSFITLLKKKKNGNYSGNINAPKYLKKGGLYNTYFTFQNSRINEKYIELTVSNTYSKINNIKPIIIPFNKKINGKVKQIILKPINNGQYFKLYITYEENNNNINKINNSNNENNKISIDLGINNFAGVFSTVSRPFIINGKALKSFNGYYNKLKAKYQGELKIKNNKYWSKRLQLLELKRENYINNYFHITSKRIKDYCLDNNISEVILGYNELWKQNINIGKINNQKFNYIPFYKFKGMLKYKLEDIGSNLIINEESYTSKCSALDKEIIEKHDQYLGNRIKRGLFKSNKGILINSDINGAINIMRKHVVDDVILNNNQSIEGLVLNPIKFNIFYKIP